MSIVYDKLVRDKIPQIIEASGKKAVTRTATEEEHLKRLRAKLIEEVEEYLASGEHEELADIIEVVTALARCSGSSLEGVIELAAAKRAERGGFEERVVLVGVEP